MIQYDVFTLSRIREIKPLEGNEQLSVVSISDLCCQYYLDIVIDTPMANAIRLREFEKMELPEQLPEVIKKILSDRNIGLHFNVYISKLVDGKYITQLQHNESKKCYNIRLSDALLYWAVFGGAIFVNVSLYKNHGRQNPDFDVNNDFSIDKIKIPEKRVLELLEEDLKKALDIEDYESAANIKKAIDEVKSKGIIDDYISFGDDTIEYDDDTDDELEGFYDDEDDDLDNKDKE